MGKVRHKDLILLSNFPGILGRMKGGSRAGHAASQLLPYKPIKPDRFLLREDGAEWDDSVIRFSEIQSVHTHKELMRLISWPKGEDHSGKGLVNHSSGQAEWSKEVWPGHQLDWCAAGQKRCQQLINFWKQWIFDLNSAGHSIFYLKKRSV